MSGFSGRSVATGIGVLAALTLWTSTASAASGWAPTGDMAAARRAHAAVTLPDGRVLAISGFGAAGEVPGAELYDPRTGTWGAAAPPLIPRHYAAATLLADGRVLLSGGFTDAGVTASSEVYDPAANTWTATGALARPRNGHSAVQLPDGRVLVMGGSDGARNGIAEAERYDPATGSWSDAGSLSVGREWGNAATLPGGRILYAGGYSSNPSLTFHAAADVFDPATSSWTAVAPMAEPRAQGGGVVLPGGRALVAAGVSRTGFVSGTELYDAAAGTWTTAARIPVQGNVTVAVPLGGRRALVAADGSATTPVFDDATGTWSMAHQMSTRRTLMTLTRLADGRILAAGGNTLRSAELYTPPTARDGADTDLGAHEVGSAVERDVRVRNTGDDPLRVDGLAASGSQAADFGLVTDGCSGTTVAPGATCTVRVRFAPSAVGERTTTLAFDDNAETSPAIAVRGTGTITPSAPDPSTPTVPTGPTTPTSPSVPSAPAPTVPAPAPTTPAPADRVPIPCTTRSVTLVGLEAAGTTRRPRVRLTGFASGVPAGTRVTVRRDGSAVDRTTVRRDGTISTLVTAPRGTKARAAARFRLVVEDSRASAALKASRLAAVQSRTTLAGGRVRVRGRIAGVGRATRLTVESTPACGPGRTVTRRTTTDRRGRFSVVLSVPESAGAVVHRIRQGTRTVTLPIVIGAR